MAEQRIPKSRGLYFYLDHFEERGEVRITVDLANGQEVWRASSKEGHEFWPVRDGFMRHTKDYDGLKAYLVSLGIMGPSDYFTSR